MSELWASSHVVVATGAVGCPPRYPIRGPLFYDAGCSVAHLSTEPEPTSGFGRTRGSSDTRMGEGQIWCSPSRSGSHTHVRPPFEFSTASPHFDFPRRSAGVGGALDSHAQFRKTGHNADLARGTYCLPLG